MKRILYILLCISTACSLSAQTRSPKRGVSVGSDFNDDADLKALQPGTSWFYNWGTSPGSNILNTYNSVYGYEFCPMAWNGGYKASDIRTYVQAHPECKYILAFNEPNFNSQANMTPQAAAAAWPALKALAQELGLKIISPACNYSPDTYSTPKSWLDAFFAQPGVSIDDIAGLAIHSYMGWATATNSYMQQYIGYYNKPIWLTEFCAWDNFTTNNGGTALQQRKEMIDMLDFLERNPMVARYAWFIARRKEYQNPTYPYMELLTNTNGTERGILTETGQVWTYMSSYDSTFYHKTDAIIEAEHYIYKSKGAYMEQTSDTAGILDVYDYSNNDTLSYNVNIPIADNYTFRLHILSNAAATLNVITTNGTVSQPIASTSNLWKDAAFTMPLNAGKQQISFKITQGSLKFNYFVITNNGATPPPTPNPPGPVVQPPPYGNNLALKKPIFSPSAATDLQKASLAVDGNPSTRWESKQGTGQDNKTLVIDLLDVYPISDMIINWEGAYAKQYSVDVSPDSTNWAQIYNTVTGSAGEQRITLATPQEGRYVRINCILRGTTYGFSIWEIEVYGAAPAPSLIQEANADQSIVATYPNPVNNILNVQSWKNISEITLTDVSGRKLLELQNINSVDATVNMANFSAGIYLLAVKLSDGTNVLKKVIKQ